MISTQSPLSPYRKALVAAIGGIAIVAYQLVMGETVDSDTVGTSILTLLTAIGVYGVTNAQKPAEAESDPNAPSSHEIVVDAATARRRANGDKVIAAKIGTAAKKSKKRK